MKTYEKKIDQARVKVAKAVELLKAAHKLAYAAGKAYEKENPNLDHGYYVWANEVTQFNTVLSCRACRAVNDMEAELI